MELLVDFFFFYIDKELLVDMYNNITTIRPLSFDYR